MFGDQRLADEIRAQKVPLLLADAEDLARPLVKAACAEAGTAAFALCMTPEDPLRESVPAPSAVRQDRHAKMPGVAVRMLTSGTTGTPKRIPLSYAELDNMMTATAIYSKRSAELRTTLSLSTKVELLNAPLVHTSGFTRLLMMVAEGNPVSLLEHFDPEAWSLLVEKHKPIAGALVPAAMRMTLDAKIPKERLKTLKVVACGTAALDPDTSEEFTRTYGIPVIVQYGATEFPGGLAGWTLPMYREWWGKKRGSVGRAKIGVEFRVLDAETKAVLPTGGVGLLAVRTPGTTGRGDDGFITTADVARLDEDGFLYISGRADDAIIRGGFKILPGEVEKVIESHPAVRAAGVIGRPDSRLGAVPVAAVELNSPATPQEILGFIRDKLAKYQVPVEIRIVDALPRTPSLKVAKPQLRDMLNAKD
jgi:acyl-CoA synthetase (AMP-forming)/AMP-acid ligase II